MTGSPQPEPWILTVDVGSSSVRAVARDANARPLRGRGSGRSSAPLRVGGDGSAVFEPKEVLDACENVIDQALASLGADAAKISAVAMDNFGSSLVAVDPQGNPLTLVLCYADTRGSSHARNWRQTLDEPAEHDRTGVRLHASYWPAQLGYLLETDPSLRKATFLPVGSWLLRQWFGSKATGASLSSMAWTGLLNRRTGAYDPTWLERLGLRENQFPTLMDFRDPTQGLQASHTDRWPVLASVPWFSPIIDGAAANVGGGASQPGTLAVTLGTTCAMRVVANREPDHLPYGLWQYRVDRQRPLVGGALTEGGGVFDWACRLTGIRPGPDLEKILAQRQPGADGLVLSPLLAGERAPGWNDSARGKMGGISLATTGVDLVGAALEGVACRLARLLDLIRPVCGNNPRVLASGGLLGSQAWRRALADALGVPVSPCLEPEATGRGMALLALEAMGHKPNWEPELGEIIHPDPERHTLYRELIEKQNALEMDG